MAGVTDGNQEREIHDIIGKQVVDGEVYCHGGVSNGNTELSI